MAAKITVLKWRKSAAAKLLFQNKKRRKKNRKFQTFHVENLRQKRCKLWFFFFTLAAFSPSVKLKIFFYLDYKMHFRLQNGAEIESFTELLVFCFMPVSVAFSACVQCGLIMIKFRVHFTILLKKYGTKIL